MLVASVFFRRFKSLGIPDPWIRVANKCLIKIGNQTILEIYVFEVNLLATRFENVYGDDQRFRLDIGRLAALSFIRDALKVASAGLPELVIGCPTRAVHGPYPLPGSDWLSFLLYSSMNQNEFCGCLCFLPLSSCPGKNCLETIISVRAPSTSPTVTCPAAVRSPSTRVSKVLRRMPIYWHPLPMPCSIGAGWGDCVPPSICPRPAMPSLTHVAHERTGEDEFRPVSSAPPAGFE